MFCCIFGHFYKNKVLKKNHITSTLLQSSPAYSIVYRVNRSTEDVITPSLLTTPTHLDQKGAYMRMLFIDYSSELIQLSNQAQTVTLSPHLSSSLSPTLVSAPQGYSPLSPLLCSFYIFKCIATHFSNTIIKFDTTVVGLITNNDETVYRDKVYSLKREKRCADNLILNMKKRKK